MLRNGQSHSGDHSKQGIAKIKSHKYKLWELEAMICILTAGPWILEESILSKKSMSWTLPSASDIHRLTEYLIVPVDKNPSFRLNLLDVHLLTLNLAYPSSINDSLLTFSTV